MKNLFLTLLLISQIACSTIMKEDWEEVFIETKPAGAVVSVSTGEKCHTPCHLELERKKSVNLKIQREGYEDHEYFINGRSFDGWIWGNLVFLLGFPIGVGVDFYTGYAYDFSPGEIIVDLKEKK